uniref:Putative secreted peptide n=1 Tax=Anopheles braziliensis TaxID=58242 RepID=A0A2M3ZUR0_9DIPT
MLCFRFSGAVAPVPAGLLWPVSLAVLGAPVPNRSRSITSSSSRNAVGRTGRSVGPGAITGAAAAPLPLIRSMFIRSFCSSV